VSQNRPCKIISFKGISICSAFPLLRTARDTGSTLLPPSLILRGGSESSSSSSKLDDRGSWRNENESLKKGK